MKFAWMLLPAVLSAPIAGTTGQSHGLEQIDPDRAHFDHHAWEQRLAAQDLDERERAFTELVDTAVTDDDARDALRAWSTDAGRPDLAWTARLALREVERRPGKQLHALKQFGGGAMDDLHGRFEELQDRFGGLDSMFEDLQHDFERMFSGASPHGLVPLPGPAQNGSGSGGLHRQSESFRMQFGPDGVTIEVDEDVNGQKTTRTYKGSTLDEVLEANPELKDRVGSAGAPSFFFGGNGHGFPFGAPSGAGRDPGALFPDDDDRWDTPARPLGPASATPATTRTDILGVRYTKPAPEVREQRQLDEGVGLEVQGTEPGTIAAGLGVQTGDVLVALNGRALKDRDDVVAALRERKSGDPVKLELVDSQGRHHTLTWNES